MLLALTEMIIDAAVNIWILVANFKILPGLVPYTSWSDIHHDFSRIQPFTEVTLPVDSWRIVVAAWYIIPIATLLFFAFFAFGQESIVEYRAWRNWFRRVILRRKIAPTSISLPSPPKFVPSSPGWSGSSANKGNWLKFNRQFPKFMLDRSSSGGNSVSPSPSSPQRFELSLKGSRDGPTPFNKTTNETFRDGCGGLSVLANVKNLDIGFDKPLPLPPILSISPLFTTNHTQNRSRREMLVTYMNTDLDTAMFDTIPHVSFLSVGSGQSIPIPNYPQYEQRSESLGIQRIDAYYPFLHRHNSVTISSTAHTPTFGTTFVPRPVIPSRLVSDGVKVEVDINVV
jgi:hypothetical protein